MTRRTLLAASAAAVAARAPRASVTAGVILPTTHSPDPNLLPRVSLTVMRPGAAA